MYKPNNVTEGLSGLHEVLTQLYRPSVSELQSIAVHVEKEALSSSHLLVAHLGGREHLAMLQRALIRYLFAHLPIRGWGQALSLPWGCLAPRHYALSLHWCCASPTTLPRWTASFRTMCQQEPLERHGWINVKLIFIRSLCAGGESSYVYQLLVVGAIKKT